MMKKAEMSFGELVEKLENPTLMVRMYNGAATLENWLNIQLHMIHQSQSWVST
jgi:hypothetical protein